MKKGTKKILLGSGIAAAAVAAAGTVSYAITKSMVKVALDREMPPNIKRARMKVSGSKKKNDLYEKVQNSTEKLENSNCETVEIKGYDGEKLVGHWHKSENAKRVIIAMHGWRSSWAKDFGGIADFLYENDCSVLFAEQRGQNNSGGEYMTFGLMERYDCLDWVKWVNENIGTDTPIYLAGISMGASTVLMAAGLELPENVHGIIADCGYTTPYDIWKHVAEKNLNMPYAMRGKLADNICKKKIQIGAKDYSCIDAMKQCTVPVIFIHGTDDRFVPIEMTYENYKACIAPKRLLIVPGAAHGMSYWTDKEKYEKEIKSFWNDYDDYTVKKQEDDCKNDIQRNV